MILDIFFPPTPQNRASDKFPLVIVANFIQPGLRGESWEEGEIRAFVV